MELAIGVLVAFLQRSRAIDCLAEGRTCTHTFDLVDYMDVATGDTTMARTTGFTAAVAAA